MNKSKATKGTANPGKDVKYKKPTCAPKRFKSAYMFFSERKHKEFRRQEECKKMRTADVAKLVSKAWKVLPNSERLVYLTLAKKDKERYEVEKANYTGPWKVIDMKERSTSKRPMSAFLAFSNARRKEITEANPMLSKGEIAKVLSQMWREAPLQQKQMYHEEENILQQDYKDSVTKGKGGTSSNSSAARDCVSVGSTSMKTSSAAVPNGNDDDAIFFGCFDTMLDYLDHYSIDDASNASRSQSVSEETARVTLTDELDNNLTHDHLYANFMVPARNGSVKTSCKHAANQRNFDLPFSLKPLIATDVGGFLAAAAMLDGASDPFEE